MATTTSTHTHRTKAWSIIPWLTLLLMPMTFTGCFTGVEGTKKISLSRKDRKEIQQTPEENFFASLVPATLVHWKKGKEFIAADNRTLFIFDPEGLPLDPDSAALKGKVLSFEGTEPRRMPDGSDMAVLVFTDGSTTYRYATGKEFQSAAETVTSDRIPMMIDLDLVSRVKDMLLGRKLWTRSMLWYDAEGNRIKGRKFVPVTIDDVEPGGLEFPIKVKFTDDKGNPAWILMNFSRQGNESRAFPKVFMLSSMRDRYPQVSDEVWNMICQGRVVLGMTKAECKLSLGNPSDAAAGRDYSQTLDMWQYPDGTLLWFEDGILTRLRK